MTAGNDEMNERLRAAGRPSLRLVSATSPEDALMNEIIRRAARPSLGEPPAEAERVAHELGCVDPDALRRLAPELDGLTGDELRAATVQALRDHPALARRGRRP